MHVLLLWLFGHKDILLILTELSIQMNVHQRQLTLLDRKKIMMVILLFLSHEETYTNFKIYYHFLIFFI